MVLWGYANISESSQQSFGIKLMLMRYDEFSYLLPLVGLLLRFLAICSTL